MESRVPLLYLKEKGLPLNWTLSRMNPAHNLTPYVYKF
jgi:hypothetical protein